MTKDDSKLQIPLFEAKEIIKTMADKPGRKRAPKSVDKKSAVAKSSSSTAKIKGDVRRSTMVLKPKNSRQKMSVRESASGQVPYGDVRLTANIREDLHLKLKIAAARRRTTIGELIEQLVDQHL